MAHLPAMASEGTSADPFDSQEPTVVVAKKDISQSKKSNIRKRTKTGCLTCRKRRIKCDEGKPICNNCIKSKRQCEGYNQRVVFKSPMGAIPGSHFGPLPYHHHHSSTEALVNAQLAASQAKVASSSQGPLPIIAPKPPNFDYGNAAQYPPYLGAFPDVHRASTTALLGLRIQQPQYALGAIPPDLFFGQPNLEVSKSPTHMSQPDLFNFQLIPPQQPHDGILLDERRHTVHSIPDLAAISPTVPFASSSVANHLSTSLAPLEDNGSLLLDSNPLVFDLEEENVLADVNGFANWDSLRETQIRSFRALAEENVLVNYMPSLSESPLNDAKIRDVFWYFVNITAPALNPYERNPSRPISSEPVPKAHQHIWTYVFPLQSFQHPALLQAILALGSLQMAELSGGASTAPLVHSIRCISKIAKCYQSAERRAQPATLAATLLLAFFEVWNSNHERWCTHMLGARHIIRETPFKQMSRRIWVVHRQRYRQWADQQAQDPFAAFMPQTGHLGHELAEVDLDLIRSLSNKPVIFMQNESSSWQSNPRNCTERELENYENLADLYWWFCKMDVYQAVLGGSKLFLEYDLWTQCPPRAPINRVNQICGTFDHLILLLGRLSNFIANDLPRKHKARSRDRGANASPTGPNSPSMFTGMFPQRGNIKPPRGLSPPPRHNDSGIPSFSTSTGFSSTEKPWEETMDLEEATQQALEEWTSILLAFNLFKNSLGPDFQPLRNDVHPSRDSPFGPTSTYRTFSIAGIWMNYYMGLVILHRAHPSMPPFAMVAAHMCAQQTEPFANEIGKIVAGITDDWSVESVVSTLVASAYIECCFPLFVGAVQFRDKLQRQWAIRRLHDITRLTGWKTGDQIANGCEGAWRKAAVLGVAPPYEPESESDALKHGYTTRRIDERIQEIGEGQSRPILKRTDRAHVAFGLLSVDEDLDRLRLED